MGTIIGASAGLLILAALFWILESLWPEDRAQPHWRDDSPTDLIYWFLGSASRLAAAIAVVIAIAALTRLLPHTGLAETARQPRLLQAAELLVLADLIGYWSHRCFHTQPRLWPIHAMHHSPERLDWLAAAWVHPLDTIITRLVTVVPLYLLGFGGDVLGPVAGFLAFYPIYLHANLSWDYGPLRYMVASPAYHRWHHSSEAEALDKNFSALLPAIDLLFGTAYFPRRHSRRYGLYGERMPRGVLAQLRYPFRGRQRSSRQHEARP